jgi:hypothetical protein
MSTEIEAAANTPMPAPITILNVERLLPARIDTMCTSGLCSYYTCLAVICVTRLMLLCEECAERVHDSANVLIRT